MSWQSIEKQKRSGLLGQAKKLPNKPGVYLFKDSLGKTLYVGKSINIRQRVKNHLKGTGPKARKLKTYTKTIESVQVESELEALLLEAALIKKHLPLFNVQAKDDKHPLYIKVTKEEFPKVLTSRKKDQKNARSFGPFPSSITVRKVLRQIRRAFAYCSQKNISKRGCFYSHINLCNPCPNEIAKVKNKSKKNILRKSYLKNIRRILMLLSGKSRALEKEIKQEMKILVKGQDFEKAAILRDQLEQLEYITKPYTQASFYLENPNLIEDIRAGETKRLLLLLKKYIPGIKKIRRIECYDVAHTSGSLATCSLVTFVNGEEEKNLYRRFRIRGQNTKDDYAMLTEVLKRRLLHLNNWGRPDLIVVDGGKGQVSVLRNILLTSGLNLTVIGLAKRLEEIIVPLETGFVKLKLKKDDPALHLLQRIRDEAHRFSRAYHFKLRLRELTG